MRARPERHAVVEQHNDPARAVPAQLARELGDTEVAVVTQDRAPRQVGAPQLREPDHAHVADHGRRRQADVRVGAEHRVRQPGGRRLERVQAVVELVIASRGDGDRQPGHVLPRPLAGEDVLRIADDEIADVEPFRRNALPLALEQRGHTRAGTGRAVARTHGHRGRSQIGRRESAQRGATRRSRSRWSSSGRRRPNRCSSASCPRSGAGCPAEPAGALAGTATAEGGLLPFWAAALVLLAYAAAAAVAGERALARRDLT